MPRKPLASARIPEQWMDQIQAICDATGKTSSEVVQEAIAAYLGQPQVNPVNHSEERLSVIEGKIDELLRLTGSTQPGQDFKPQISPERSTGLTQDIEPSEIESPELVSEERLSGLTSGSTGLTLKQICDRYGMSYQNLHRNAKAHGQSKLEYLRDQTGVQWVQRGRRYFQLE